MVLILKQRPELGWNEADAYTVQDKNDRENIFSSVHKWIWICFFLLFNVMLLLWECIYISAFSYQWPRWLLISYIIFYSNQFPICVQLLTKRSMLSGSFQQLSSQISSGSWTGNYYLAWPEADLSDWGLIPTQPYRPWHQWSWICQIQTNCACWQTQYIDKEVNPSLAQLLLNFNGSLYEFGLTSFVKWYNIC